jgi:hypothetical protein
MQELLLLLLAKTSCDASSLILYPESSSVQHPTNSIFFVNVVFFEHIAIYLQGRRL